jgi:hypothetical protein
MLRRDVLSILFGGVALALTATSARGQLVHKLAEELKNGEYNWFPERSTSGPLLIIVSIPDQKVHVYRNGIRVAASTCSTGKPGHATPTGVFKILQKDKHHRSSTYNNAPMPNMNRLTWSGVALHAGNLPGYPASHGCVRLPLGFSELLFGITQKGMTVVIADNSSQPASVVHPSLVLGKYPREAFHAVAGQVASAQQHDDDEFALTHTSLVVSGKDRKISLYENHHLVAEDAVDIEEPERPLRSHVYHLNDMDHAQGAMVWHAAAHGNEDGGDGKSDLHRIRTKPEFAAEVHRRLHRGALIVTTPDSHSAEHRTAGDFVIVDSLY